MILERKGIERRQNRILAFVSAILWFWLAHGYRFANNLFSHDGLLGIWQDDYAWEISLGRFLHPVLLFIRGGISSPWLISMGTMIWFALSVYLVVDILDLERIAHIIVVAGIMVCNITVIATNTVYIQWTDMYTFSLFLAVFGVWCVKKNTKWFWAVGLCSLVASMGIYQAYICVAITLFMILMLDELRKEQKFADTAAKALLYMGTLILAALLYYLAWQVFMKVLHIPAADTYNGLTDLGDYSQTSFLSILVLTYQKVFLYFWNPEVFATMIFRGISLSIVWKYALRIANILVIGRLIYDIAVRNRRVKILSWQSLLQLVLLLLLPAGMNFVCVLSKGMEHTLMVYAFIFVYIMVLREEEKMAKPKKFDFGGSGIMMLCVLGFIWTGVVLANQVYLKKSLQDTAMESLMTRIMTQVESTEGYEPGITPVAFSGSFENSPYIPNLPGFENVSTMGMGKTVLTYLGTDYAFIKYKMNVEFNGTRVYATDPQVQAMPCYPEEGSIAYIDDVLVVKIADRN